MPIPSLDKIAELHALALRFLEKRARYLVMSFVVLFPMLLASQSLLPESFGLVSSVLTALVLISIGLLIVLGSRRLPDGGPSVLMRTYFGMFRAYVLVCGWLLVLVGALAPLALPVLS